MPVKRDPIPPPSQDLIEVIASGLRAQAATSEIRAAVVCYDIKFRTAELTPKTDAICASLGHVSGEAVDVLLPYELRRLRGPKYGELIAVPGTIEIFENNK